jgi:hypothetical protein
MAPLTELTSLGNKKFHQCWTYHHKHVFDKIKLMIASHVLLNYPAPSLAYVIKSNASSYQLGAIIKQANHPLGCFGHNKLTSAQQNYSTIKKEIFSCIETFEEYYHSILKGTVIRIHHDHNNLTYKKLCTERDSNWCNMIKAFCPNFIYKPGKEKIVADCLSQHPQFKEAAINKHLFYNHPSRIGISELRPSLIHF